VAKPRDRVVADEVGDRADRRVRRAALLLLLGHADYYPRFGFESARCLGIEPPQPWLYETWLALRLPGWTPDLRGVARYAPAFGVG
jgi:putative acetyltransferase